MGFLFTKSPEHLHSWRVEHLCPQCHHGLFMDISRKKNDLCQFRNKVAGWKSEFVCRPPFQNSNFNHAPHTDRANIKHIPVRQGSYTSNCNTNQDQTDLGLLVVSVSLTQVTIAFIMHLLLNRCIFKEKSQGYVVIWFSRWISCSSNRKWSSSKVQEKQCQLEIFLLLGLCCAVGCV